MSAADLSAVQLGFHLARLRESSDLKQIELARRVTMSPSALSRQVAGRLAGEQALHLVCGGALR
ncbi:MAG TPA: helix-turn-helix domain-containing protein [Trebonia sp.]|jgi:DNA transposition AAA+ family ATPase|nr:helix-turn-helix domain-containing protein [Trebonia sp.]